MGYENKERTCDLFCENFGFAAPVNSDSPVMSRIGKYDVMRGVKDGFSYSTIFTGKIWRYGENCAADCARAVSEILGRHASELCKKKPERILVASLGNEFVTADSLGVKTAAKITATGDSEELARLGYPKVFVIKTGVSAQSGLSSYDIVSSVADKTNADMVIAIDSLAAKTPERLASVIQVSDAGIVPGSGASSHSRAIDRESLGRPVITIGAPTVIRASIKDEEQKNFDLYTCGDIDSVIECYSLVIALAVNDFFSDYCHK